MSVNCSVRGSKAFPICRAEFSLRNALPPLKESCSTLIVHCIIVMVFRSSTPVNISTELASSSTGGIGLSLVEWKTFHPIGKALWVSRVVLT